MVDQARLINFMYNALTALQAYSAMLCFLDNYYDKTLSDDLGSFLGDLQLLHDGSGSWDPAAWHDWMKALGADESITMLRAMISFLNAYYQRTLSIDIKVLLDRIQPKESEETTSIEWNKWVECINKVANQK